MLARLTGHLAERISGLQMAPYANVDRRMIFQTMRAACEDLSPEVGFNLENGQSRSVLRRLEPRFQ